MIINHRWRRAYYHIIFWGIICCIVAMIYIILFQLPKQYKDGTKEATQQNWAEKAYSYTAQLKHAIKAECLIQ